MESPGASFPELSNLYDHGKAADADATLAEYYRANCNAIESSLVRRYPQRAKMIAKAFAAHTRQEFDIAIPLFLIQGDGICREVFGRDFFRVKNKALAARDVVESASSDELWQAIAEPFRQILPIAGHATTGAKYLNRHLILHGDVLDYDSEINSLKAISLLSYLNGLDAYLEGTKNSPVTPGPSAPADC